MLVKRLHPAKAYSPKYIRFSGSTISHSILVQLRNAFAPISTIFFPNFSSFILLQFLKAFLAKVPTLSPIINVSILLKPENQYATIFLQSISTFFNDTQPRNGDELYNVLPAVSSPVPIFTSLREAQLAKALLPITL